MTLKAREANDVSPIPSVIKLSLATTRSMPAAVVMTNYEKSEDRFSENVEGVKEAKIVKARDTPDAACILLTAEVLSKK